MRLFYDRCQRRCKWHEDAYLGALARRAIDRQPATHQVDSLLHAPEPNAAVAPINSALCRIEAKAVVFDAGACTIRLAQIQIDLDICSLRMLEDIRDRLLNDPIQRDLDRR